ncbi:MAG: potassium-transporting ATPase subunit C, partial [Conexivisphaera sp.]
MASAREIAAPLIVAVLALAVLGVAYPLVTWALGALVAPWQSGGSLLALNGTVLGSDIAALPVNSSKLFSALPPSKTTSGIDPYVPLGYALSQVPRISNATGIPQRQLRQLVYRVASEDSRSVLFTFGPSYPIVNVAQLNYELIRLYPGVYG